MMAENVKESNIILRRFDVDSLRSIEPFHQLYSSWVMTDTHTDTLLRRAMRSDCDEQASHDLQILSFAWKCMKMRMQMLCVCRRGSDKMHLHAAIILSQMLARANKKSEFLWNNQLFAAWFFPLSLSLHVFLYHSLLYGCTLPCCLLFRKAYQRGTMPLCMHLFRIYCIFGETRTSRRQGIRCGGAWGRRERKKGRRKKIRKTVSWYTIKFVAS